MSLLTGGIEAEDKYPIRMPCVYFLFLKPLPVGNHTLYYEGGTGEPNPNQYAQSVTYPS